MGGICWKGSIVALCAALIGVIFPIKCANLRGVWSTDFGRKSALFHGLHEICRNAL